MLERSVSPNAPGQSYETSVLPGTRWPLPFVICLVALASISLASVAAAAVPGDEIKQFLKVVQDARLPVEFYHLSPKKSFYPTASAGQRILRMTQNGSGR